MSYTERHFLLSPPMAPGHRPGPAPMRVAVLVPCRNEGKTVARVVDGFCSAIPGAVIYVYDNNSSDQTAEAARRAGAVVRAERAQGKGNVVRRMFADVDADVYVLVDGDATYDPTAAPEAIERVFNGCDMINIAREAAGADRRGHGFGNWFLTSLVGWIFGTQTSDMLSGYKVFSRRFVKTFPALSSGFEIETELMVHSLELRVSIEEIQAPYGRRPEGSSSKLRTVRDGVRILRVIGYLVKNERPLAFFSTIAALLAAISSMLGVPVVLEFFDTGLVPRLPTAVLSASLMILAVLSFFAGLILDNVTVSRREAKRLAYLNYTPLLRPSA